MLVIPPRKLCYVKNRLPPLWGTPCLKVPSWKCPNQISADTKHAGTLTSDFPALGAVRNKFISLEIAKPVYQSGTKINSDTMRARDLVFLTPGCRSFPTGAIGPNSDLNIDHPPGAPTHIPQAHLLCPRIGAVIFLTAMTKCLTRSLWGKALSWLKSRRT